MLPDRTDRQTGRERKFQFPIAVQQSYVYWKSAWRNPNAAKRIELKHALNSAIASIYTIEFARGVTKLTAVPNLPRASSL